MRFPAEWEAQSGVMIAWPHDGTDWAPRLAEVETTYVALVAAITRFEPVVICVRDAALRQHAESLLCEHAGTSIDLGRIRWLELAYDDTWLRDSGPITLIDTGSGDRRFHLLDFRFTGWGGKYRAEQDDALVSRCFELGLFSPRCSHAPVDFALEGGAVESDGAGRLLTTWACLHQRHPERDAQSLTAALREYLCTPEIMMLDRGYLDGDDTDAHIDTLARFAPGSRIVFQGCRQPDDKHHEELTAMAAQLAALRNAEGQPYELLEMPWAAPIYDESRRLAASYANYLIVNGAVLYPSYGDPADRAAADVLAKAYPGRDIVGVPCRPLIWQNGSLHCITMQLPQGVLS
nr:agmatine deiminase family protein [Pseudomarimonas arenosa]